MTQPVAEQNRAAVLRLIAAIAVHRPDAEFDQRALADEVLRLHRDHSLYSQSPEVLAECWVSLIDCRLSHFDDEDINALFQTIQKDFAAGCALDRRPTWVVKAAARVQLDVLDAEQSTSMA